MEGPDGMQIGKDLGPHYLINTKHAGWLTRFHMPTIYPISFTSRSPYPVSTPSSIRSHFPPHPSPIPDSSHKRWSTIHAHPPAGWSPSSTGASRPAGWRATRRGILTNGTARLEVSTSMPNPSPDGRSMLISTGPATCPPGFGRLSPARWKRVTSLVHFHGRRADTVPHGHSLSIREMCQGPHHRDLPGGGIIT
jgi:hypothetical protein